MTLLTAQEISVTIGTRVICQEFTLTIEPGDIIGLLGLNGSGKTTLLHALAGLHPLAAGRILLKGKPLTHLSAKTIAQSIAILFQHSLLDFNQTVWEYCLAARYPHLAYFQHETLADQQITYAALKAMHLTDCCKRPISQLSGGEKRRLAIAAVLAQTPEIYLLDEPANHLDIPHQFAVLKHLQIVAKTGSAVVMALHDVNLAQQFCTKTIMLGKQIICGKTNEVLTKENLLNVYNSSFMKITQDNMSWWYMDSSQ